VILEYALITEAEGFPSEAATTSHWADWAPSRKTRTTHWRTVCSPKYWV